MIPTYRSNRRLTTLNVPIQPAAGQRTELSAIARLCECNNIPSASGIFLHRPLPLGEGWEVSWCRAVKQSSSPAFSKGENKPSLRKSSAIRY